LFQFTFGFPVTLSAGKVNAAPKNIFTFTGSSQLDEQMRGRVVGREVIGKPGQEFPENFLGKEGLVVKVLQGQTVYREGVRRIVGDKLFQLFDARHFNVAFNPVGPSINAAFLYLGPMLSSLGITD
jgi:hypothetical protein